jgi:hypothetical protein
MPTFGIRSNKGRTYTTYGGSLHKGWIEDILPTSQKGMISNAYQNFAPFITNAGLDLHFGPPPALICILDFFQLSNDGAKRTCDC